MNTRRVAGGQGSPAVYLCAAALCLTLIGPASAGNPILYDSFNDDTPFSRASGYNSFAVTPDIGSEGILRYWEPGYRGSGAVTASHIDFSPAGRFGNGVSFNYSGSDNGWCTQDAINYPIGDRMRPEEGTIEFWYKPHFDDGDTSAVIYVISGFKTNLDHPLATYDERQRHSQNYLNLFYAGWSGRHFWSFRLLERDAGGRVTYNVDAQTPGEYDADRFRFAAEQWMHIALVWKGSGMASYGGKTLVLFIDGNEAASTTQRFAPRYPFGKYLVLGSGIGQSFDPSLPGDNYSGASGDIDNLKVWDFAKTDFSDRFDERAGIDGDGSRYVAIATVPDMNGNDAAEIASLRRRPDGILEVVIRDGLDKTPVSRVNFGRQTLPAIDLAAVLDLNGTGSPEIAVLLKRPNGQGIVQIRDATDGRWIAQMRTFGDQWEVQAMTAQDADLDGVSELSVLGTRDDGKAAAVQIIDAMSEQKVNWIGLPAR